MSRQHRSIVTMPYCASMKATFLRFWTASFLLAMLASSLSGCGPLYEHETEAREYARQVAPTVGAGETRQKVRSVLGKPLVDAPTLGLEVYRKSGRDIGIGWVLVPWAPVPYLGDKAAAVALVLYDEKHLVTELASGLWEGTRHAFGHDSVDANGFSFTNVSSDEPATLLSPPVASKYLATVPPSDGRCSVFFVMDRCPLETIHLDGREIADFPNAGRYCEVDDERYQPVNHVLYGTLLWIQVRPGKHTINVSQRLRSGDFEKAFECEAGDSVYAELQGSRLVPDAWYGTRLEGSVHIAKSPPVTLMSQDQARFMLWHEGSWFGAPNSAYLEWK